MEEEKGYDPVGVFYFGLEDKLIEFSKGNSSIEEIEEKIKNHFKMSGFVVREYNDSPSNFRATKTLGDVMDENNAAGISNIDTRMLARIIRDADKIDIQELQATTKEIVKQISKEILKGKIDIKPYNDKHNTGCTYCKYGTICNFSPDSKGNNYYYI